MEVRDRKFQGTFYLALKKRLDALHYCQPLSLSSAALVDTLLNDLLKITEKEQNTSKILKQEKLNCVKAQENLAPFQAEVARYGQENNQLHLEMMTIKEQVNSAEERWRVGYSKLEDENKDLRFIIQQNKSDYKILEAKNAALVSRLETALSKAFVPSSERGLGNPDLFINESYPGKLQDFQVSRVLLPSENFEFVQKPENESAEELKEADERLKSLEKDLEEEVEERNEMEDEVKRVEIALANRDREIDRLTELMSIGKHVQVLPERAEQNSNSFTIKSLNEQVDFLNRENVKLEEEVVTARIRLASIASLEKERDNLYVRYDESLRENERLKTEIEKMIEEPEQLRCKIESFEEEKMIEIQEKEDEVSSLEKIVSELEKENSKVSRLEAAYASDRKAYTETIQKLSEEKKEALEEVEFLKENEEKLVSSNFNSSNEVEAYRIEINNLKQQLNLYSKNIERLSNEQSSAAGDFSSIREQLSLFESRNALIEHELNNLKFELQKTTEQRDSLEHENENLLEDLARLKSEIETNNSVRFRLSSQLESFERQTEVLSLDNESIERLREEDKIALKSSEDRERDIEERLNTVQDNHRNLQREYQLLQDEFTVKVEELRRIEQNRMFMERDLAELKPLKIIWEESKIEVGQLKEKLEETKDEVLRYQRELLNKESEKTRISSEKEDFERRVDNLYREVERLTEENQILRVTKRIESLSKNEY